MVKDYKNIGTQNSQIWQGGMTRGQALLALAGLVILIVVSIKMAAGADDPRDADFGFGIVAAIAMAGTIIYRLIKGRKQNRHVD